VWYQEPRSTYDPELKALHFVWTYIPYKRFVNRSNPRRATSKNQPHISGTPRLFPLPSLSLSLDSFTITMSIPNFLRPHISFNRSITPFALDQLFDLRVCIGETKSRWNLEVDEFLEEVAVCYKMVGCTGIVEEARVICCSSTEYVNGDVCYEDLWVAVNAVDRSPSLLLL